MEPLFQEPKSIFFWKDVKTFQLRNQYNEILNFVTNEYYQNQYKSLDKYYPSFLNTHNCLTLKKFDDACKCGSSNGHTLLNGATVNSNKAKLDIAQRDFLIATSQLASAKKNLDYAIQTWLLELNANPDPGLATLKNKVNAILNLEEDKRIEEFKKLSEVKALPEFKKLTETEGLVNAESQKLNIAKFEFNKPLLDAQREFENAKNEVNVARIIFESDGSRTNEERLRKAEEDLGKASIAIDKTSIGTMNCHDIEKTEFCQPNFSYERVTSLNPMPPGLSLDLSFNTHGLTVGAVIWMYYYERMGIFKILGALMDDYNYRGKYTISGSRKNGNGDVNSYSTLMDMICTLHRIGISSSLRDRIATYEKVLGVSIENNMNIVTERNVGFMKTLNKLIDYMLEYYKAKQLAQAIQSQNGSTQPRSSVATQTSIRDTLNVLKQQLEPLQYGRNQINTFIGISTIHATLCLLNMLKTEIGIPAQYEKPEEFIPAAYDILVENRKPIQSESNRFIIYDNCASYGYRLLTDIETVDIDKLSTIAVGSTLDTWLNDVEGIVEGYRNAHSVVPEKAPAMAMA